MTPQERERILVDAAERYLRGEIDLDEHNRIRDAHRFDYRKGVAALQKSRRPWWRRLLGRLERQRRPARRSGGEQGAETGGDGGR